MIVDADGFVTDWLVLGPFAAETGQGLDRAFVDETALRPEEGAVAGDRTWRRVSSAFPQVDLASFLDR